MLRWKGMGKLFQHTTLLLERDKNFPLQIAVNKLNYFIRFLYKEMKSEGVREWEGENLFNSSFLSFNWKTNAGWSFNFTQRREIIENSVSPKLITLDFPFISCMFSSLPFKPNWKVSPVKRKSFVEFIAILCSIYCVIAFHFSLEIAIELK